MMSNSSSPWNSWFALSSQALMLGFEAQRVIWLRLMRLATGGARSQAEAQRMVTEKFAAFAEAQTAAVTTAIEGGGSRRLGKKVAGVYKKRMRDNRRRLTR
jgi:hypothetical protein